MSPRYARKVCRQRREKSLKRRRGSRGGQGDQATTAAAKSAATATPTAGLARAAALPLRALTLEDWMTVEVTVGRTAAEVAASSARRERGDAPLGAWVAEAAPIVAAPAERPPAERVALAAVEPATAACETVAFQVPVPAVTSNLAPRRVSGLDWRRRTEGEVRRAERRRRVDRVRLHAKEVGALG